MGSRRQRGDDDRVMALLEEALTRFRTVHYQSGIAEVGINLVRLDHRAGDDHLCLYVNVVTPEAW